ncbi:hypothetical protein [Bacillus sp. S14(2024)]|uniref:hypothetical protein n=1 Tax=Bacillus sp. S14(2024) TaxID=3162884 RepID=UPI003D21DB54
MTVRKRTQEEFINAVYLQVGDEYSVLGIYINNHTKILMQHNICSYQYSVTPKHFLRGVRCPKCAGRLRKTTAMFKEEVYSLVKDEYLVLGEYITSKIKLEMRHNTCGFEYHVKPNHFLRGVRCPKCYGNHKKTTKQFIQEVRDLVKEEYTVLGEYVNTSTKCLMRHNICNYEYEVKPNDFLFGNRCPKCYGTPKKSHQQFLKEVYQAVQEEYTVLEEYVNAHAKIEFRHNKCSNTYMSRPGDFLKGVRCPFCNQSHGEMRIQKYLEKRNIVFKSQFWFDDCKDIRVLKFDFAVFSSDGSVQLMIEYDGEQHFNPYHFLGGEEEFQNIQRRDHIKNKYCLEHGIRLVRIPYYVDNIEEMLEREIRIL